MKISDIPANYDVIYKTAKTNDCFIFHKPKKTWYTPDEFLELIPYFKDYKRKDYVDYRISDFVLKSPFEALKFYNAWLTLITDKIVEIQSKIDKEYDIQFRKK